MVSAARIWFAENTSDRPETDQRTPIYISGYDIAATVSMIAPYRTGTLNLESAGETA